MSERIKPTGKDIPYSIHWTLDVKGKIVLDIGADVGSTADYFLRNGAKEVIAVEGNRELYAQLEENSKIVSGIKPVYKLLCCYGGFEELIEKYKPDIVKIDCEGMELHLINVNNDILRTVKEYMVEVHSPILWGPLFVKFIMLRYAIIPHLENVFYAIRIEN